MNKTVIITGTSSGIGRETALVFADYLYLNNVYNFYLIYHLK